MAQVPLHPSIVHVPIGLSVVMPLVTLGLALMIARNGLPRRAWWLAVALQAVIVGASFLAARTGDAEEGAVERVAPESAIEAHEDAAKLFLWGGAVASFAAIALTQFLPGTRGFLIGAGLSVVAAGISLALAFNAGKLGGELVYTHNAGKAYAAPSAPAAPVSAPHD